MCLATRRDVAQLRSKDILLNTSYKVHVLQTGSGFSRNSPVSGPVRGSRDCRFVSFHHPMNGLAPVRSLTSKVSSCLVSLILRREPNQSVNR